MWKVINQNSKSNLKINFKKLKCEWNQCNEAADIRQIKHLCNVRDLKWN